MTLHHLPIAILDYETTGPDPSECMPVQVCVAHWTLGDGDPAVVLNERINPGRIIPEGASAVHGITDDMVADCPTIEDLAPRIVAALDGRMVMAYNAPFEANITTRLVTPLSCLDMLDPSVLVKHEKLDKFKTGKRLTDCCARRGYTFDAHDAQADVLATAWLLERILPELCVNTGRVSDHWRYWPVEKFLTRQRGLAAEQERDYASYCERMGKPAPDMRWVAALSRTCDF